MSNVKRFRQLRAVLLIVSMSAARAAAQTTESIPGNPPQQAPANDTPPEPAGTAGDRSSGRQGVTSLHFLDGVPCVMLAAGGVLALAVHRADDYVEEDIVGNPTAEKFFAARVSQARTSVL